jgi:hypothetical protein
MSVSKKTDEPLVSVPRRGNGLLLFGSLIGLVSATGLAWKECGGDVVHEVLMGRDATGIVALGQSLIQLGGCLLGAVVGGTLVSIGVRQAARRNGLSLACVMSIGLYGLLALFGTFAVCLGTFGLRTAFSDIATSGVPMTAEQFTRMTSSSSAMLSLGWKLLAMAQVALLVGSAVQCVTRPKYVTTTTRWPVVTIAALIQLGLSGVIVSALWIRCGLTFGEYANGPVKASDVVNRIQVVLFCNWAGSCVVMGYALLITVLACQAAFTAWSPLAPIRETSSDLS